jgi:hypothetical protein
MSARISWSSLIFVAIVSVVNHASAVNVIDMFSLSYDGIIRNHSFGERNIAVNTSNMIGITIHKAHLILLFSVALIDLSYKFISLSSILSRNVFSVSSFFSSFHCLSASRIIFWLAFKYFSFSGSFIYVFLSSLVKKKTVGVPVSETNNDATNVVKIVIGIIDIALPITHGSIINGMNTTTVVAVQEISEFLYVLTDNNAA